MAVSEKRKICSDWVENEAQEVVCSPWKTELPQSDFTDTESIASTHKHSAAHNSPESNDILEIKAIEKPKNSDETRKFVLQDDAKAPGYRMTTIFTTKSHFFLIFHNRFFISTFFISDKRTSALLMALCGPR